MAAGGAILAGLVLQAQEPPPSPAAPSNLTNLLEELTARVATNRPARPAPLNPPPMARTFRSPSRPKVVAADLNGYALRDLVAALWAINGRLDRALGLIEMEPAAFRQHLSRMTVAHQMFAIGRDAEALRLVEAEPSQAEGGVPDLRSQTLLAGATARLKAGERAQAEAYLAKAARLGDTNDAYVEAELWRSFANVQLELRQTNDALASLDRAVKLMGDHRDRAAGNNPWVQLRDAAEKQAQLGQIDKALATAALILDDERRVEARQLVVRAQMAAGDLTGAAQTVLAAVRADADYLAGTPYLAAQAGTVAGALDYAGQAGAAAVLLEQTLSALRARVKGQEQGAALEQAAKQLRAAAVMGVLAVPGQPFDDEVVYAKRLSEAEKLAAKLNVPETEVALGSLRDALRIRQDIEAGKPPSPETVDVSTPEAQGRAQQFGLILARDGQAAEAARVADRLPLAAGRPVYAAAISAAISAAHFDVASALLARFPHPEPNASQWRDETWDARLGLELARREIVSRQTNAAAATLRETLRRLLQGPAPQSANVQFLIADVARLQAELGFGPEAVATLVAASQRSAGLSLFAPDIGRRLARSLGESAAANAARSVPDETLQEFLLVGIAQELSRPGLTDPQWRE
jgi:tetratricopeptide (TPR) repeat protein